MAQTATVAVIRANAIRTGGAEAKTHYGCDLVIEDGIVAGVDIEIDATGYIVVPGLVNCHTHAGCTPNGIGERGGNNPLEEVVTALTALVDAFSRLSTNVVTEQLAPSNQLLAQLTGLPVSVNKLVVGANVIW